MFDAFAGEASLFAMAFSNILTLPNMLTIIFGSLLGVVIGAIPGLTATMALALLINITYGMELNLAICFMLSVYGGAVMGGCISAIMINIPGTPPVNRERSNRF